MRMYDIIKKKRDGFPLTEEEIRFFVKGYVDGSIPDYQAAAFCMAVYFRGMSIEETTALTLAIRDSGDVLHFDGIEGVRVDKHSTGGVGDKTSLVVAPIVASLGIKVAKMSGRGLGHTGGTVDKLESFEGFRADLETAEFIRIVNEVGICIVGQSKNLAPADKKLYALRDVIATVDSMPLIVSSIMGKKLAADDDCIVLDVKTGSGSFMKTKEQSEELARLMVDIGKRAGKKMRALITNMDVPLGSSIGNSLEVIEAINTLNGHGPKDFTELCCELATNMLELAGKGTLDECRSMVQKSIQSRSALETFAKMVGAQGGNPSWVYDTELFPQATFAKPVYAHKSGYITQIDTEAYGMVSLSLGAGRNVKEDPIDYTAGIILEKKTGDYVKAGECIATFFTSTKKEAFEDAERQFLDATTIEDTPKESLPLILSIIS